jgi:hypothetical protein
MGALAVLSVLASTALKEHARLRILSDIGDKRWSHGIRRWKCSGRMSKCEGVLESTPIGLGASPPLEEATNHHAEPMFVTYTARCSGRRS